MYASTEPYLNDSSDTTAAPQTTDQLSVILNILIAVLLAVIMVGMGCAVEIPKILFHLKRPTGILTGFVCQFGLMPLIAYLLTLAFQLSDIQALALLIQASCPGGSSSNVATYWMRGDMDLSITMTTCSTLLALGMMPLLLFLYGQGFDESLVVPFESIAIILASLVVPIALGVFIRYKFPRQAMIVLKVCSIGGIIIIGGVAVLSIVTYGGVWKISAFQVVTAIILPVIGMLCGYGISSLVSLYKPLYLRHFQRRTVCVETGIQNTQLTGSIILLSGFSMEQIGEMIIVPLLYAMAQVFWALCIAVGFRVYEKKRGGRVSIDNLDDSESSYKGNMKETSEKEKDKDVSKSESGSNFDRPPSYSSSLGIENPAAESIYEHEEAL